MTTAATPRGILGYEHRSEPLLPLRRFFHRLLRHAGWAAWILLAWLGVGVLGYHWLLELEWVDALLDASMILSGMGPVHVDKLASSSGGAKVFASVYAL